MPEPETSVAGQNPTDKTFDVAALKKMLEVADIILIAQRAKPAELLAIKAGLDAAFGDDWRDFKPSKFLCDHDLIVAKQTK